MKALTLIPAAAIAVALFATGCGNNSCQKFTTDTISCVDSVTFDNSKASCSIDVAYPVTGGKDLISSTKQWIARQLAVSPYTTDGSADIPDYTSITDGKQLLEKVSTDLMAKSKTEFEEFAKDSITVTYEFYWNITPVCDSTKFVTYASSSYAYLGGAHGGAGYTPATFDKSNGRIYGWDMFIPDSLPTITDIIKNTLMTNYFEVKTPEEFRACLLIDPDTMPLPQTPPSFMADGIDFTYMQYEIAPYAAGMPDCIIPYSRITPMLTPEAKELLKP